MSYKPTIQIFPIRTKAQCDALEAAAKTDSHEVLFPTHYVLKDGEVVGYLTTGWCVNWWLHSEKCDARDSSFLMCALETLQAEKGIMQYVVMCSDDSPYSKVIEAKFGVSKLGTTDLYAREMTNGML